MHIDGACHCGLISFTAEIDPTRVMVCHCSDCQVLSGSPFRVSVAAPMETFVLHGQPKSYIKVAESGNRRAQLFCPECATPLFAMAPENATFVIIRLGCVKQRAELTPAVQLWQRSSMRWISELNRIPGSPKQEGPARPARRKKIMTSSQALTAVLAATTLGAAGCVSGPVTPPDVPAPLRPPAGQSVFLEALATGVQIYECAPKSDQPSAFEWAFRAPEASLADRSGRPLGKHYAGPTWESLDGSSVVGEVKARDQGPTPSAIPWLLLASKSTAGAGIFSQTKSIQRVQTVGGIAPSEPCTSANAKQIARVSYTATYYFYR